MFLPYMLQIQKEVQPRLASPKENLQHFILCRDLSLFKSKLPKKGKLQDAINEQQNLIKMAWKLRATPNLFLRDDSDSLLEDLDEDSESSAEDMLIEDNPLVPVVTADLLHVLGDVAVAKANINYQIYTNL